MANVLVFSGFDFDATPAWGPWGPMAASYPSHATFGNVSYQHTYYGTLNFDGSIYSGTVTSAEYVAGGLTMFTVSGAAADYATLVANALAGQAWLSYPILLAGADQIDGSSSADTLFGYAMDDVIAGNGNDDTIDGGTGTDHAVYYGNFAEYTVTYHAGPNYFTITDSNPYRDGQDTLYGVEYFVFNDQTVSAASYGAPPPGPPPPGPPPPPPPPGQVIVGTDGEDLLTGGPGDDVLRGGAGDDRLFGGAGNDVLDGGTGADYMEGGAGADLYYVDDAGDQVVEYGTPVLAEGPRLALDLGGAIDTVIASIHYTLTNFVENLNLATGAGALTGIGNELDNVLTGNEANNVLKGGAGNDRLDGLGGIDTAVYDGARANYTVLRTEVVFRVTANSGSDGSDLLTNMERLQFADGRVALDMSVGNSGGKAALLVGAVLGRGALHDQALVGALLGYFDAGPSLHDAATMLVGAGVMAALAGGPGNKAFVDLVFTNVVGAAPSAELSAQLTSLIDGGVLTQADFLGAVAAMPLNQANVDLVGLSTTGMAFV